MAENSSNLWKDLNIQVHEANNFPPNLKPKRSSLGSPSTRWTCFINKKEKEAKRLTNTRRKCKRLIHYKFSTILT